MSDDLSAVPIEVEQKFRVQSHDPVFTALLTLGAIALPTQSHADTYFGHPSRDLAATKEALRIRRISTWHSNPSQDADSKSSQGILCEAWVTYKGPYLPGGIKAREELEWPLAPGDPRGEKMQRLLESLGFREKATVRKVRRPFSLDWEGRPLIVTLDRVERVGDHVEIEAIAAQRGDIEAARSAVLELANRLGMGSPEPRSYLTLWLQSEPRG